MLTKAKCPACGGALELNPGLERGICVYCGGEFLVQEAIQKLKAEVDGLPTLQNMLIRAEQKLSDADVEGAKALYKKILEGAPTCHEAWWGMHKMDTTTKWVKNISKMEERWVHLGPREEKITTDIIIDDVRAMIDDGRAMIKNMEGSREALRALEYAPDDVKDFYRWNIEQVKKRWEAELVTWEAKINGYREKADRKFARNLKTALLISGGLVWGFLYFVSKGPGPSIPIGGWITMFVMYTGMLCPFVMAFIEFISGGY